MLRNELPQDATLEEVQAHMCDYIDKAKVTKASVASFGPRALPNYSPLL